MTKKERYKKFKDIIMSGNIEIKTQLGATLTPFEELVDRSKHDDNWCPLLMSIDVGLGESVSRTTSLEDGKYTNEWYSDPYKKATLKELYEKYGILLDKDEFQGKDCSTHVEIKFARNHEAYGVPHIIDSLRGVDYNSIYEIIQEN